jgi:hypothetical protein
VGAAVAYLKETLSAAQVMDLGCESAVEKSAADRMRASVAGSLAKTYEEVTSEAAGETTCLGQAGIAQTDALTPDCFVPECLSGVRMLVQRTRAETTPRRRVVLRVRSR